MNRRLRSASAATLPRAKNAKNLVGVACSFCEEDLDMSLLGERPVQLQCGHVAHGQCILESGYGSSRCFACEGESTREHRPALDWQQMSPLGRLAAMRASSAAVPDYSTTGEIRLLPSAAPVVTLVSEFPSLAASSKAQVVTVLVRVEVPEAEASMDKAGLFPDLPLLVGPSRQRQPTRAASYHLGMSPSSHNAQMLKSTQDLRQGVADWHGLSLDSFGRLQQLENLKISKDAVKWQYMNVYLFDTVMLCTRTRQKKTEDAAVGNIVLSGNVLLRRHLERVTKHASMENVLSLSLSSVDLPHLCIAFATGTQLNVWLRALLTIISEKSPGPLQNSSPSAADFDRCTGSVPPSNTHWHPHRWSSKASRTSSSTMNSDLSTLSQQSAAMFVRHHSPSDLVIVLPLCPGMQAIKLKVLKETLRFVVSSLGQHGKLCVMTYGNEEPQPHSYLESRSWMGWNHLIESLTAPGSTASNILDVTMEAVQCLSTRTTADNLASVLLIGDKSSADLGGLQDIVETGARAHISFYTFGIGMLHDPQLFVRLSDGTRGAYTYVRDWHRLQECIAGSIGWQQSTSVLDVQMDISVPHRNVKLGRIAGAQAFDVENDSRGAHIRIGNMCAAEVRETLVQLIIQPSAEDDVVGDHWDIMVSRISSACADTVDHGLASSMSQQLPLLSATISSKYPSRQQTKETTLSINRFPKDSQYVDAQAPQPIRSHSAIIRRKLELVCADMMEKSIQWAEDGLHEPAARILTETRAALRPFADQDLASHSPAVASPLVEVRTSDPLYNFLSAVDVEICTAVEWLHHPSIFHRDTRKRLLQLIRILRTQCACSHRTPLESLFSESIVGVEIRIEEAQIMERIANVS